MTNDHSRPVVTGKSPLRVPIRSCALLLVGLLATPMVFFSHLPIATNHGKNDRGAAHPAKKP